MDGVIIIDKQAGMTSHDVVARARRILRLKRVGHTGTLDPFATGVIVLLLGRATRLAQFLSGAEKEYEATVRFGYATDTGDATGRPKEAAGSPRPESQSPEPERASGLFRTRDEIEAALAGLRGEIEQVPPMYSAKKVGGRKLYELARRGEEIERKAVRVIIRSLEILDQNCRGLVRGEDGTCELGLRVVCSAGTYIRVLAETIGERLGVPAHLAALRRTRAGHFRTGQALTLGQLEERVLRDELGGQLISPDAALSWLPVLHLTTEDARRARHGMSLRVSERAASGWSEDEPVRMVEDGAGLVAVGLYERATKTLRPRVVLAGEE